MQTELLEQPLTLEAIEAELSAIEAQLQRRRWARDPDLWAEEKLGDTLWSGQRDILRAVRDYRKTAAATCHEIGKSYDAAILAAWWVDIHKKGEAVVVTTAPTFPQVEVILWKEIGRAHQRGSLDGRVNTVQWKMKVGEKDEIVAFGRKPSDYSPAAFQGIHAPFVLVIVDEANGVRGPLWDAFDSLAANDGSKILIIGNPDDPTGEFYEACKPGSGFKVLHISAFDSPNFTGEAVPYSIARQLIGKVYVEERRKKWAPTWTWTEDGSRCVPPPDAKSTDTHPYWQSKILGVFPEISSADGLIPISWVLAAQARELGIGYPIELGLDVGAGGDESAECLRRGSVYRIVREDRDPDTMSQCGKTIADMQKYGASLVKVDKIGIGWGLVNRAVELNHPFVGVNVGEGPDEDPASDERFVNLKAQLYWGVRELFETGNIDIDPFDEELAAQLISIRFARRSDGKIQILPKKKDAAGRPLPSPNRAEALMLATAPRSAARETQAAQIVTLKGFH